MTALLDISPSAALGQRSVNLTTAGGIVSTSFTFDVIAVSGSPTLTAVSPVSGVMGATIQATLSGSNFVAGATSVSAVGTGVVVQSVGVVSASSLTATLVLSGASGAYTLTAATSGGTSNTVTFTINANTLATTSNLSVTTLAGGFFGSTAGVGTAAKFTSPDEVWGEGNLLYVLDSFGIRTVDLTTAAVTTPTFTSSVNFSRIGGVWGDGKNLYITDQDFNVVRRIEIATGRSSIIAGLHSTRGGSVDGTGTTARFDTPFGIWGDGANLYVADLSTHTIRKIVIATGEVTTLAGLADAGSTQDGIGANARIWRPRGVWGDGENLYVVEGAGSRVRKIVIATGEVTTLRDDSNTLILLNTPSGIWGDGSRLYVTDNTDTIRTIDLSSGKVTIIAGQDGVSGSADGPALDATFTTPWGITGDGNSIFVSAFDRHTIRRLEPNTP